MSSKREFDNPFEDFCDHRENNAFDLSTGAMRSEYQQTLQDVSTKLLSRLQEGFPKTDPRDYSVYTGSTGVALLYFLLSRKPGNASYLNAAIEIVESALPNLKKHRVSFLNGDPGPLALGAVLYSRKGDGEKSQRLIERLKRMIPKVVDIQSDLPDEILYGRTGYLYALLFLNKMLGKGTIDSATVKQVVKAILQSGQALSSKKRNVPLMYMWHQEYYVGAAHGLSGILYLLLQAKEFMTEDELNTLVRPTIDYLQGIRFPSDNFPSSLGNTSDKLVQWCHGAPGVIFLYAKAYEVYGDKAYLDTAVRCGEVVWKRGILTKGYSICHGVSGNAYTFLKLYQLTQKPGASIFTQVGTRVKMEAAGFRNMSQNINEKKYLHRACKFAEWCFTYGKKQYHPPDRPMSLFEGIAGVIYFLEDIQQPMDAKFPAFEL